ncbi:MAG: hypothetical protein OXQ86_11615 [Gammaproteobacteria bacterium]|nr:hypothetical protein [Gammaproteobacteria bacterium]MDE0415238.1 hypothetical protein [Gammaproteobacteria bacterium]
MTEPELDPSRFKLGFSTDVAERLRHHRVSAPFAQLVRTWPCKALWEKTAIDSIADGCEQLGTEVFRTDSIQEIIERADRFFALMPPLSRDMAADHVGLQSGEVASQRSQRADEHIAALKKVDAQIAPGDSDVGRLVHQVRQLINLNDAELSDEFFPAHLSIALIDALFTPQLRYYSHVVPIIERYCARFNLRRIRPDWTQLPPVDDQETLADLLDHYKALGPGGFQEEIVRARYRSPGTKILKSENVKRAAIELRRIGIETLQDAQSTSAHEIKCALRPLSGIGDRTIHMFLMYTGDDEYVKGDVHVCRFVAAVLQRPRVSADEAERLVGSAARALGIAPRLLDYEIWKYGAHSSIE